MRVSTFAASVLAFALCLTKARAEATVELTDANFKDLVLDSGKNSFVKFYAPWCGHCKKLAPDWEKLAEEYEGSPKVIIGHVDCTVHQSTCSDYGVTGYPTLKFFTGGDTNGEPYQKGRDLASLKSFAEETLDSGCLIDELDACTEKEQKYHAKWTAKGSDSMVKELERLQGMSGKAMKPELKQWLVARINILKQATA